MLFDPVLIVDGFMDRLVDLLGRTASVLGFSDLCSSDDDGVIIQQYGEEVLYFQKRWTAGLPVIEGTVSLSLSYTTCSRCPEIMAVVEVLFSGTSHDNYQTDFRDVGIIASDEAVMLSSVHFVR